MTVTLKGGPFDGVQKEDKYGDYIEVAQMLTEPFFSQRFEAPMFPRSESRYLYKRDKDNAKIFNFVS